MNKHTKALPEQMIQGEKQIKQLDTERKERKRERKRESDRVDREKIKYRSRAVCVSDD